MNSTKNNFQISFSAFLSYFMIALYVNFMLGNGFAQCQSLNSAQISRSGDRDRGFIRDVSGLNSNFILGNLSSDRFKDIMDADFPKEIVNMGFQYVKDVVSGLFIQTFIVIYGYVEKGQQVYLGIEYFPNIKIGKFTPDSFSINNIIQSLDLNEITTFFNIKLSNNNKNFSSMNSNLLKQLNSNIQLPNENAPSNLYKFKDIPQKPAQPAQISLSSSSNPSVDKFSTPLEKKVEIRSNPLFPVPDSSIEDDNVILQKNFESNSVPASSTESSQTETDKVPLKIDNSEKMSQNISANIEKSTQIDKLPISNVLKDDISEQEESIRSPSDMKPNNKMLSPAVIHHKTTEILSEKLEILESDNKILKNAQLDVNEDNEIIFEENIITLPPQPITEEEKERELQRDIEDLKIKKEFIENENTEEYKMDLESLSKKKISLSEDEPESNLITIKDSTTKISNSRVEKSETFVKETKGEEIVSEEEELQKEIENLKAISANLNNLRNSLDDKPLEEDTSNISGIFNEIDISSQQLINNLTDKRLIPTIESPEIELPIDQDKDISSIIDIQAEEANASRLIPIQNIEREDFESSKKSVFNKTNE